jgi:hypothetical protein
VNVQVVWMPLVVQPEAASAGPAGNKAPARASAPASGSTRSARRENGEDKDVGPNRFIAPPMPDGAHIVYLRYARAPQ